MADFGELFYSFGRVLLWAAILGFADVLGLMVASVWLGHRRLQRKKQQGTTTTGQRGLGQAPSGRCVAKYDSFPLRAHPGTSNRSAQKFLRRSIRRTQSASPPLFEPESPRTRRRPRLTGASVASGETFSRKRTGTYTD